MLFKKKKQIEFVNEVPGVAETMPMIPAKQVKRAWVSNAMRDFAEARKNLDWNKSKFGHVARCPGMFTMHRHGWVMRAWQDFTIATSADNVEDFSWICAADQSGISHHGKPLWADHYAEWKPNTLRNLVKVVSGWVAHIPRGYYLLECPLPHYEEHRFTVVEGFWPSDTGPVELNPSLYWHVLDGTTLIKAGTPLAQYILVPEDTVDMVCKGAAPTSTADMRKFLMNSRFVTNYAEMRKLFGGACD